MLTLVAMSSKAKIILSVSNDLHDDQRLMKVCKTLRENDHELELLGRYIKGSSTTLKRPYLIKRFHLWFNKGPLFYFNLNVRLFWHLLFAKYDLLIANDLDTLPANYLAARLRSKPLVYDAHEYFTEVPELIDRPRVKAIWESIEKRILPKLKHAYTVSPSIAKVYKEKYGLKMALVRNFPLRKESFDPPPKERVVIYQGALNVGRGLEELISAFSSENMGDIKLWIFGKGDIEADLKALSRSLNLNERVFFFGRKASAELLNYTRRASLGVSLEHPMGLSYQYAIPNKLFDYLQAGTAVLYAPLKEVEKLLDGQDVGEKLKAYDSDQLARQIREILDADHLQIWHKNARMLSENYCWEKEEKEFLRTIEQALMA